MAQGLLGIRCASESGRYALRDICRQWHTRVVRVDWTDSFDRMLDDLDTRTAAGDSKASQMRDLVYAQLALLQGLPGRPKDDTATLRRVRQSGRYELWRLSHPYVEHLAVSTIVWFADDDTAVVALFANNKASMGDVFYDSVGSRADQMVGEWLRQRRLEGR